MTDVNLELLFGVSVLAVLGVEDIDPGFCFVINLWCRWIYFSLSIVLQSWGVWLSPVFTLGLMLSWETESDSSLQVDVHCM